MARKKKINKTEYIYKSGDKIQDIARKLTGHSYMVFRLLEKNEKKLSDLKDGDLLKWE